MWKVVFGLLFGAAVGWAAFHLMGAAGLESLRPGVGALLGIVGIAVADRERRRARRRQP